MDSRSGLQEVKPVFKPFYYLSDGELLGDLIKIDEFLECVRTHFFIDYDGHGRLATKTKESDITVIPSKVIGKTRADFPKWATHVLWFNR